MIESKLEPHWDALLGEGDGVCGTFVLARSLSRLPFFSLLLWRLWRSITISMLSKWRKGALGSVNSAFTGVMGGVVSRTEYELVRDLERAKDVEELFGLEIERRSALEPE